jgi:hypothetical protein
VTQIDAEITQINADTAAGAAVFYADSHKKERPDFITPGFLKCTLTIENP